MDDPVAYKPLPPLIKATILNGDEWTVETATRANATSLTVLEHTTLTLICLASYSVLWYGENGSTIPWQTRHCNPTFNDNVEFCANLMDSLPEDVCILEGGAGCTSRANNSGTFLALQEFNATIVFVNLTKSFNGSIFICRGRLGRDGIKVSAITIAVRSIQPDQDHTDYLLQSGFRSVHLLSDEQWDYSFQFVYVQDIPENYYDYNYYLHNNIQVKHSKEPIVQDGHDTDISHPEYVRGASAPVWVIKEVRLREDIWDGVKHEFLIENTTIKEYFETRTVYNEIKASAESRPAINGGGWNILLTSGTMYSIWIDIGQTSRRLFGPIWVKRVVRTVEYGGITCVTENTTDVSVEECGIVSAVLSQMVRKQIIQITIKATRPCEISHAPQERLASTRGWPDVTAKLAITIAERQYFNNTTSNGLLVYPLNETKSSCSIEAYEKQTIILQCVAACRLGTHVEWCKQLQNDCVRWEENATLAEIPGDNFTNIGNWFQYDPEIRITSTKLGNFTMALNLIFPNIRKRHTGTYQCVVFYEIGLTLLRFPTSLPSGRFDVIVEAPIAPRFTDHIDNDTKPVELANKTVSLDCAADGRPPPVFSWYITDKYGQIIKPLNLSSRTYDDVKITGYYKCIAANFNGTTYRIFNVVVPWNFITIVTALCAILGVAILTIPIILVIFRRKNRKHNDKFKALAEELRSKPNREYFHLDNSVPLSAQVRALRYNRQKYEIDRRAFSIKSNVLGAGEFGIIYRGEYMPRGTSKDADAQRKVKVVAVKMPKDLSDPQHHRALVDELKIMCSIQPHANVLCLVGACTDDIEKRQLFVLTEYCHHGSLREYLVENRSVFEIFDDTSKTVQLFLRFAYYAANGMEHLGGQNIIHRDLALRNLLLTEGHIVKIADFGMSRRQDSVYRKALAPDVPVPIFWMALESLTSDQYTQQSDVWSFGIVLWEMFNCGRRPYPDHEPDSNFRSWLRASEQNRMAPPQIVCEEMYDLMRQCWKEVPDKRPTFSQCKRHIGQTLETRSRSMYVSILKDLSDEWENMQTGNHQPRGYGSSAPYTEEEPNRGPVEPQQPRESVRNEVNQDQETTTRNVDQSDQNPSGGSMEFKENEIAKPYVSIADIHDQPDQSDQSVKVYRSIGVDGSDTEETSV